MTTQQVEQIIYKEDMDAKPPKSAKVKYKTQNDKVWSLNFSALKWVKKAQVVIPALKKRIGLQSMGLTVLMAIEYCQQEEVIQEFLAFVNTRRRALQDKQ